MPKKRNKSRHSGSGRKAYNPNEFIGINLADVAMAQKALRAINHPLRRRIMLLIKKNQPVTVTQIFTGLKLDQSFVSQYLMILRAEGFVNARKVGRQVFYFINYKRFGKIARLVRQFKP